MKTDALRPWLVLILTLCLALTLMLTFTQTLVQASGANSPPARPLIAKGDEIEVFTNTWSYSTIGMVYDPDRGLVRYAHESQSSTHNPTIYDVTLTPTNHTAVYSFALSTQNSSWPWQLDNCTGVGYDYVEGTYFIPDYNGDLSYADDNIVEVDAAGNILNAWETDDEVGSNDSSDGSSIDEIIDIAVVPGAPTRYFATAAYDDNVVYEIALQKTGTWWTPNSWHTVATCTVPLVSATDDNLGIDYDAENGVLYHSSWDTTTLVLTDLTCNDGLAMTLVDSLDCPGAGGYNSGVSFIEGSNPPEVWVTDFSSDKTTRCQTADEEYPTPGWGKVVAGTNWVPGLNLTTETSGTFQVTDVITAGRPFTLTELWNTDRLLLTGVSIDPPLVDTITATGALTITGNEATPDVVTVTKEFSTRTCTWAETVVSETLVIYDEASPFFEQRPFTMTKTAPILSISANPASQVVYPGGAAKFTLIYTNTGGFENDVAITNTFPVSIPFIYANPAPNDRASDGSWARWDVGNLATDEGGEIDVYVYISETLSAGQVVTAWDGIYNHVGTLADEVAPAFEIAGAVTDVWTKTVDTGSGPVAWSPTLSLTLETYDTFTVTDVIDTDAAFNLTELWLTSELELAEWNVVDPGGGSTVDDSVPGILIMTAGPAGSFPLRPSGPITLTKVFTVESCSWPLTVLGEFLYLGDISGTGTALARPVLVQKDAPVLALTAHQPITEIHGGETVSYTLTYSNTGGYENAFSVQADFPTRADFASAVPAPTTGVAGDPTITWVFTGGLETGQQGLITVTVQITDEVPPATRLEIDNTLLDHANAPRDIAIVTYEAGAPTWEKYVNGGIWSDTVPVDAGDVFTVTEIITSEADFRLIDRWGGDHLTLLTVEATPGTGVVNTTGLLTWTVTAPANGVTLTKRFRAGIFDTSRTVLWEDLYVGGAEWERRPVILERQVPDLRLTKSVTPETATPGDTIIYTLDFSNVGPGVATGVVLTDTVPVSVTGTTVVSSGVQITDMGVAPPYVWQIADLAAGAGGTITITGVLSDPLPASLITNIAEIAAENEVDEGDSSPGGSDVTSDAAYVAVDGTPLVCTLNPISGTTHAFCNGICGSVTFVNTGTVSSLTITYTQHYPSINGQGLPRQYRLEADGTGFEAQLTLCYEDGELEIASIPASSEGTLRGFRYAGSGLWTTPGTQSVDTGGNTVTIDGVTQFSAWGIGIPGGDEEPTALRLWRIGTRPNFLMLAALGTLALLALELGRRRRRSMKP